MGAETEDESETGADDDMVRPKERGRRSRMSLRAGYINVASARPIGERQDDKNRERLTAKGRERVGGGLTCAGHLGSKLTQWPLTRSRKNIHPVQ